MPGETAPDRRIVTLTGSAALPFLQGIVSNDVLPLAKGPGLVWCALLTPQGKYLVDFFVANTGAALLLDLPEAFADATLRRLTMYRLRADVQFHASSTPVSRGMGPIPMGALPDPRHPAMGWRLYGAALGKACIDWNALRVENIIPETGVELIPEESYLLEMGFDRLHGVDFRKGCYVGQEVTARMKHKTELKKGLVRVMLEGWAPVGTEVTAGEKVVGRLFTQADGYGLAFLRFDQSLGILNAGAARLWRE